MDIFEINGYWKDDKVTIDRELVSESESIPLGFSDEDIFYSGLSEENLNELVKLKEASTMDFVVTSFRKL